MSKYTYSIWKRKTSSAQVKLFSWKWDDMVNWKTLSSYITRSDLFDLVYSPIKVTKLKDKVYFHVSVTWSWESAQAQAIRHGISRALASSDESLKQVLRQAGFLTRDSRIVERKKPWRHKARKSMQWSKR